MNTNTDQETIKTIAAIYEDRTIISVPFTENSTQEELAALLLRDDAKIKMFVTYSLKGFGDLTPEGMYCDLQPEDNTEYLSKAIHAFTEHYFPNKLKK